MTRSYDKMFYTTEIKKKFQHKLAAKMVKYTAIPKQLRTVI